MKKTVPCTRGPKLFISNCSIAQLPVFTFALLPYVEILFLMISSSKGCRWRALGKEYEALHLLTAFPLQLQQQHLVLAAAISCVSYHSEN